MAILAQIEAEVMEEAASDSLLPHEGAPSYVGDEEVAMEWWGDDVPLD
jgi:hypothetical protein